METEIRILTSLVFLQNFQRFSRLFVRVLMLARFLYIERNEETLKQGLNNHKKDV